MVVFDSSKCETIEIHDISPSLPLNCSAINILYFSLEALDLGYEFSQHFLYDQLQSLKHLQPHRV